MNAVFAKTFAALIKKYGGKALEQITEKVFLRNIQSDFRFDGDFHFENGRVICDPNNPLRLTNISDGWKIVIPIFDFESDLGSIPNAISEWFKSEKMEHYARLQPDSFPLSYALHDAMYSTHQITFVNCGKMRTLSVSRVQADVILFLALSAEDARWLEAQLIYRAVRMFGAPSWKTGFKLFNHIANKIPAVPSPNGGK